MQSIAIVYKNDERAIQLAEECRLKLAGYKLWLECSAPGPKPPVDPNFKADLVLSLGGDGTLLYAVRAWGIDGTPVLGVNLGQLGFLAETEVECFPELLKNILDGNYLLDQRQALEVCVTRSSGQKEDPVYVLNDAVLNKGHLARVTQIEVEVEGYGQWSYRADGLIISTPTGSTAYNLSAGGPVVFPSIQAIVITPICPFSLSSRPLILPADFVINITWDPAAEDVHFSGDGQVFLPLYPNDKIVVRQAPQIINLISNPHRHFLGILKHKLGWAIENHSSLRTVDNSKFSDTVKPQIPTKQDKTT